MRSGLVHAFVKAGVDDDFIALGERGGRFRGEANDVGDGELMGRIANEPLPGVVPGGRKADGFDEDALKPTEVAAIRSGVEIHRCEVGIETHGGVAGRIGPGAGVGDKGVEGGFPVVAPVERVSEGGPLIGRQRRDGGEGEDEAEGGGAHMATG